MITLSVGFEHELGDEFGADFGEFDEFGGHFLVCLREKEVRGVGLEQEIEDEFDEFGDGFDEFGRGFGTRAWR